MDNSISTWNNLLSNINMGSSGEEPGTSSLEGVSSVNDTDSASNSTALQTPEELAPKFAAVVKALQKKDYRNLFMWPWTESFAPGFRAAYPSQATLKQVMQDISDFKVISVQSLHDLCYVIFENVAQFGGDSDSFLFKYAKKMQYFLQRECQKQFPAFQPCESGLVLANGTEYLVRKRKAGDRSTDSLIKQPASKLTRLEDTVVQMLTDPENQESENLPLENFVATTATGEKVLKIMTPNDSSKIDTSFSYINMQPKYDRNKLKVKPYRYHNVGPFSSHAPSYDSSLTNFSKEESDLLYEEYFGKPQKQFAREMLHFARKNNFITTYFAQDYYDSVINDPTIPDDIEIPSHLAEASFDPPTDEELKKLKDLAKLGIDVSFLDQKTHSSKSVPTEKELRSLTSNELLERMMKLQSHRLSKTTVNAKLYPQEEKMSAILLNKLALAMSQT